MEYNFDKIIHRSKTDSLKWSAPEDMLPMWVADMDFNAPQEVTDELVKLAQKQIWGYSTIPDKFYEAIQYWWEKRHHYKIDTDCILPTSGTISAISALIRLYSQPGDGVILQTPVYDHFFKTVKDVGRNLVINNLLYSNGQYMIDFDDLNRKAKHPSSKILLLCNPQNPIGRIWNEEELEKIADICFKNNIIVISDEIHSDIVYKTKHVTFLQIAIKKQLTSFICTSPSKTFNLSGLQIGYIIISNTAERNKLQKQLQIQGIDQLNSFAVSALIASYVKGEKWLDELRLYLDANYSLLVNFMSIHLPQIKIPPLQATYLVWLDCSYLMMKSSDLGQLLYNNGNVWLNSGDMYGEENGTFLRINIACPRIMLVDGLNRIKNVLDTMPLVRNV
jgi:cystathionine beta-lyase